MYRSTTASYLSEDEEAYDAAALDHYISQFIDDSVYDELQELNQDYVNPQQEYEYIDSQLEAYDDDADDDDADDDDADDDDADDDNADDDDADEEEEEEEEDNAEDEEEDDDDTLQEYDPPHDVRWYCSHPESAETAEWIDRLEQRFEGY